MAKSPELNFFKYGVESDLPTNVSDAELPGDVLIDTESKGSNPHENYTKLEKDIEFLQHRIQRMKKMSYCNETVLRTFEGILLRRQNILLRLEQQPRKND